MAILDTIKNFFDTVLNFGQSLLDAFMLVPRYFSYLMSIFANLPWFISGAFCIALGVCVVRLIFAIVDLIKL